MHINTIKKLMQNYTHIVSYTLFLPTHPQCSIQSQLNQGEEVDVAAEVK